MKNLKYIAGGLLVLLIAVNCFNSSLEKPTIDNTPKWYAGGTLHKSKISDWKKATEENKLATCADFVANIEKGLSLEEIRPKAENLKTCINEASKGSDATDNQLITEVAALCVVLMENQK